jgi:hypothetical protein
LPSTFHNPERYRDARRIAGFYLIGLVAIVLLLGLLHCWLPDLRVGRVYWFNLDKERNVPTWFSGAFFFFFGCAALIACYWESRINQKVEGLFRAPILWLVVAAIGLAMSLDEITILHENLFWREVRRATAEVSGAWKYLTQWQVLFGPAILLVSIFMLMFFANRLNVSRGAKKAAFGGLSCWLLAFFLEGLRLMFKGFGGDWYSFQVLAEELLEMAGAIFLIASVVFYTLDITLDLTDTRTKQLSLGSRLLSPQTLVPAVVIAVVMFVFGGIFLAVAKHQEKSGANVPSLVRKALKDNRLQSPDGQPDQVVITGNASSAVDSTYKRTGIWFDALQPAPLPPHDDIAAGLKAIMQASATGGEVAELPTSLTADEATRMAFLSMSDGKSIAVVTLGAGAGLGAALIDAWSVLQKYEITKPVAIKLDIVDEVQPAKTAGFRSPMPMERSLFGLALDKDTGRAFLAEELYAHTLIDQKQTLRTDKIDELLQRRGLTAEQRSFLRGQINLQRFSAQSFVYDNDELTELYRGHRMWPTLTRDQLMQSAQGAGRYLTDSIMGSGMFVYKYLPKTHQRSADYNMVRHAGTMYSMLDLYATTKDKRLFNTANIAAKRLASHIQPYGPAEEGAKTLLYKGKMKLGGVALAAVGLVEHVKVSGKDEHRDTAIALGEYIRINQKEDGSFVHTRLSDGTDNGFVSEYYPGEAILALMRIYSIDPQDKWLDVAERNATYLITIRDLGKATEDLIHDHWLLYGINELYRKRPKPIYMTHAMRIVEAISMSQVLEARDLDHLGCFNDRPESTPTATRSEGLLAAYNLAKDHGHEAEAKAMLPVIIRAIQFELQNQYYIENAMYALRPDICLGAFRKHLTSYTIRIDYVQHNLTAVLALYRLMEAEGIESLPLQ